MTMIIIICTLVKRANPQNAHGAYRAIKINQHENGNKELMQSTKVQSRTTNNMKKIKHTKIQIKPVHKQV